MLPFVEPEIVGAHPAGKGATKGYECDFEQWWAAYPRKIEKRAAWEAWRAERRKGATAADLLIAVKNYAEACAGREPRFVKHATSFLHRDRWRDFLAAPDAGSEPVIGFDRSDPLAAAFAEVCGIDLEHLTGPAAATLAENLAELRKLKVTPELLQHVTRNGWARLDHVRDKRTVPTPRELVTWWPIAAEHAGPLHPRLRSVSAADVPDVCPLCGDADHANAPCWLEEHHPDRWSDLLRDRQLAGVSAARNALRGAPA